MDSICIINLNNENYVKRKKVAGFDMDHTLIKPKSGKKFPEDKDDWEWMYENVPGKLKELYKDGYDIIIFSNQNGVEKGKQKLEDLVEKIKDMSNELQIPLIGYLMLKNDYTRKPSPYSWNLHSKGGRIQKKKSFYVGDAAGRIKAWDGNKKTKKDFSCSDRKFAMNIGIPFYTEQEFFLNKEKTKNWSCNSFEPKKYLEETKDDKEEEIEPRKNDAIILVGPPGSGKSTISKDLKKKGYIIINRDTLKTIKKCEDLLKESLKNNKSIVIDNLNQDKKTRKKWIDIIKKYPEYKLRTYVLLTTKEQSKHMNIYREKITKGKIPKVPDIVYNIYYKKYEEPTKNEGFDEVNFIKPKLKFKYKSHKDIFMEYT